MKTKLLLLLLLANFSFYAQTNLVPNGDFESWSSSAPTNWFRNFSGFVSESAVAQSGSSSAKLLITSSANFLNSVYFQAQAGKTYRITVYHRVASGTLTNIELSLYHKPSTFKSQLVKKDDAIFSSTTWRKLEFEYTTTVTEDIEVDIFATGATNSEILLDNVSVIDVNEPAYTLIPDVNFENLLIYLGLDSGTPDGKVKTANVATEKTLNIYNGQDLIKDLTGIEAFKELENLYIYYNKLEILNVSQNKKLVTLEIPGNNLTNLDVSSNTALKVLDIDNNKFKTFDISSNIELETFYASNNELEVMDFTNNINLKAIGLYSNKLTNIDVQTNLLLESLGCGRNQLTSVNVSKNTALLGLECGYNKLLTSLDITNNKSLIYLSCNGSNLDVLNIENNLDLTSLVFGYNNIKEIDVKKHTKLVDFYCHGNQLTSLDISNNNSLVNFMCQDNKLTAIDVSHNPELEMFDCLDNQIRTIDISKNPKIYELACENNQLVNLNLKNGNNTNIRTHFTNFTNNPNLTCIVVDDVAYSNANWAGLKDATASYSTACTLGLETSVFDKVALYPNPTKGDVTITNLSLNKATVYNSVGQLVKSFTLDTANTNNTISLSGLPKGIYYVYLINQDAASAKKVIVE